MATTTEILDQLQNKLSNEPYSLALHIRLSHELKDLGYPDFAAGYAYKALLLIDEILEDSGEYHEQALDATKLSLKSLNHDLANDITDLTLHDDGSRGLGDISDDRIISTASASWREIAYRLLVQSLLNCGCLRSAMDLCLRGIKTLKDTPDVDITNLENTADLIRRKAYSYYEEKDKTIEFESLALSEWPEQGYVRREIYPWNDREPERRSEVSLQILNTEMQKVAPKLEVCVTDLPSLFLARNTSDQGSQQKSTIKQLGVFASEDLRPGETVLDETSVLTSNNRLNDTLCDACSSDLPDLDSNTTNTIPCAECGVAIFCSEKCHDLAQETYHPALCDRDVEAIAKDVPPTEAADALYTLLLLRTFAMAETQDVHPLDLKEVKYIWGDFNDPRDDSAHHDSSSNDPFHGQPRTLPWTFAANILLPLHMLEKMDIDIFASAPRYDFWTFNTLYAKFRGTASARLTGRGGGVVRGPEVGAVHPLWCLANHSCDPNVAWEWGGSIKFTVREERKKWKRGRVKKTQSAEGEEVVENGGEVEEKEPLSAGIRKGEEILGHYCDIDLPVGNRREWAAGALGGRCLCERCRWESHEMD